MRRPVALREEPVPPTLPARPGRRLTGAGCALVLSAAGVFLPLTALAKGPQDFVAPRELTPEERAAAKAQARSNLPGYSGQVSDRTEPFPWFLVSMCALLLLGAAPFALRYFRSTAVEIEPTATAPPPGPPRRRSSTRGN